MNACSCIEILFQLGILYVLLGMYCVECISASVVHFVQLKMMKYRDCRNEKTC